MPDREKIIGDLEGLTWDDWHEWHSDSEVRQIAKDAIELLKEQEPLAIRMIDDFGAIKFGFCPTCNAIINNRGYPKSCGCGQAVKWE